MSETREHRYDSTALRFVLVEPQNGGNVGSAARAMKNLGFHRLELVRPDCDPLGAEARRMAVGAADLLEAARVHTTLDSALDGCRTVLGSTARAGKQRKPHWRIDRWAADGLRGADPDVTALLFGREDHGLSDADLDRCTHLVYLPADPAYTSFNLAQAVLLVGWELRRAEFGPPDDEQRPATDASREAFYTHLELALRRIGFVTDETAPSILRRLRRLYGRAGTTEEELATLRGMARQILWAADKAGL